MTGDLTIRNMTRSEVDELVAWAAAEGWNPGQHDADIFWATDPDAFIAAEKEGELIGGGAITSYAGDYGFMGFFIVRPEFRGRGFGDALWHARRDLLLERLKPDASIGMDGVFDMQAYYAKGGFEFSHRNLRYRLDDPQTVAIQTGDNIVDLSDVPFESVAAYDRRCFPAPRENFLRKWIAQKGGCTLGFLRNGELEGFAVARVCREGYKVGPLYADNADVAHDLFVSLSGRVSGGPIFLDVPENNPNAMDLVRRYNMAEVFGCARMYLGGVPNVDERYTYGVSTFELG